MYYIKNNKLDLNQLNEMNQKMAEDFKIIEVKNVMKAGRTTKIKTWEEFVEIAKNNKVDKVYKYGKLHFMLLSDGLYQIKKK